MTYKHIAIIALVMLALVVPASAVWSNGHWITSDKESEYFGTADVNYDPQTGVTSKYNPVVNTDPDRAIYGWVQFMLRSGGLGASLPGSQIVYVRNLKAANTSAFNSSYYPDGTVFDNTNPEWMQVEILPDGMSDTTLLASGEFEACIADGNSGQPECQKFTIGNAQVTRVAFLGHAVSKRGDPNAASIDAYFGKGDIHLDWIKLVKTGEHWTPPMPYSHCVLVMTQAAYDDPEYYTVVEAASHQECHGSGRGYHCHTVYDGNCKKVSHGSYDFKVGNQKYKFETNGDYQYTYHPTVHHDAVYETQCHTDTIPGHMVPEFGFEYQIDITRAHVDINNPNSDPVDVKFSFDLNYYVDTEPWFSDHDATDGSIIPQTTPVYGHWENVGAGVTKTHGFINPPVGPAVMVYDWSHGMQYFPTISNAQVTSTSWS